jgi:hypothetical protein
MKWVLKLYPPAWRERYEAEMLALLEQHHVTWRTLIDLLRGAVDARFDPYFGTPKRLLPGERARRLRHAHTTVFWAFPLLVMGHLFFLDELDDVFHTWNRAHTALWRCKAICEVITAAGFIAFLLAGLLLTCILIRQALSRSRGEIPPKLLCYTLAPITLAVVGMAAQTLFIAIWGLAIWNVAPRAVQQMAQAADRPHWPAHLWHLQLFGGMLWMALITGWALWRLGRGLTGLRREETPGAGSS